jgi:hypothetical protein
VGDLLRQTLPQGNAREYAHTAYAMAFAEGIDLTERDGATSTRRRSYLPPSSLTSRAHIRAFRVCVGAA